MITSPSSTASRAGGHTGAALRALCIVVALALVLPGCTRFLYNKIDTFIVWKVGGYVSLTREQKQALKTDLQSHLDYVRFNDLPRMAALLDRHAREIESGVVTAATFDARYNEAMALYDDFMLGIVPLSERFLRGLSDAQIAEFFANLDEINDEMYEEYSGRTPEEREANRNKSALKAVREFTGRLTSEQEEIVTGALARMEDASEEWIDYQREWQRRFRVLVTERPPAEEYHRELTQLFVYPRQLHSREYRERVNRNRAILNTMLEDLLASLSDRQRENVVEELDDYVEFLEDLAANG